MADCECIAGCVFFNDKMANMSMVADIYKQKYCRGDSSICARHMVFKALGKGQVPADLFPNMEAKAASIIAKAS
jgi:hypothetical protein